MDDNSKCVISSSHDDTLTVMSGSCPLCATSAVWAFSIREPFTRVLLEPDSGTPVRAPHGSVVVVASESGRLSVSSPWVFRLHVCNPLTIQNISGDYTAEILARSCPVDSCLAPPAELCVSSRYDVLPRPHGARVALSAQRPWTADEVSGTTNVTD